MISRERPSDRGNGTRSEGAAPPAALTRVAARGLRLRTQRDRGLPSGFWRPTLLGSVFFFYLFFALAAMIGARTADAEPSFSADVTAILSFPPQPDESVVEAVLGSLVAPIDLGLLPPEAEVDAHERFGSNELFSLDGTTRLASGLVVEPADVVRYDGSGHALAFDASAAGLSTAVNVDAVALIGDDPILSFDTTVDLGGGLVVADEDLVIFSDGAFIFFFDGSEAGLDPSVDLDAASWSPEGVLSISLDKSGEIAGAGFDDDSVVSFDGARWGRAFDLGALYPGAERVDLKSVPEPRFAPVLFAATILLGGLARTRRRHVPSRRVSTIRSPGRRALPLGVLPLAGLLVAPVASAIEGQLEIDQRCAELTGCFAGDTPGFPVTLNGAPGSSYRLTSNLQVPDASTTAIQIATSGIDLDLNGFAILGVTSCSGSPNSCAPTAIGSGVAVVDPEVHIDVSVHDGVVARMGSDGLRLGRGGRVEHVRAIFNAGHGISVGDFGRVSRSVALRNGTHGIDTGFASVVDGNSASENRFHGIDCNTSTLVSRNAVFDNGLDGIHGQSGTTVRGNSATSNGRHGISAGADSLIALNAAFSNGDEQSSASAGVTCGGGCLVRANAIRENQAFGLISSGITTPVVYSHNLITGNTGAVVTGTVESRGANLCAIAQSGLLACP